MGVNSIKRETRVIWIENFLQFSEILKISTDLASMTYTFPESGPWRRAVLLKGSSYFLVRPPGSPAIYSIAFQQLEISPPDPGQLPLRGCQITVSCSRFKTESPLPRSFYTLTKLLEEIYKTHQRINLLQPGVCGGSPSYPA